MARKPRLHVPGALYHVMLHSNGGQSIFFADDDWEHFEALVAEGVGRFGHRIHGYCWMSNHIHLAVQVAEVPLSRIMQNLAFRYTRWVNKRQGRVGHLFQGRYKAILVEAESYLLELVRYIHLNPVRARLVEEPAAYRWSGHRAYVGQAQVSWLTTDWVLSQLAGTERVARRRYAAFIAAGQGERYRKEFHRGTADGRLLGDEDFVAKTLSQVREKSPLRVEPERIIEVVCAHRKIEAGQLATADRSRAGSEARTLSAYLAVELGAASLTSMGQRFNRDVATMSNRVRQFRRRLAEDKALAEEIRMLQSELTEIRKA